MISEVIDSWREAIEWLDVGPVFGSFILFLALFSASSLLLSLLYVLVGIALNRPDIARQYSGILSGLGSLVLVILTGWYAKETRNMAETTEASRRDDRMLAFRNELRERISLRQALLQEIAAADGIEEESQNYSVGASDSEYVAPRTVYENNADNLGLLEENEAEAVVVYYTGIETTEEMIHIQRVRHSPYHGDVVRTYFRGSTRVFDQILSWLTQGWTQPKHHELTESIRERYELLADAKEEAENLLRENLKKDREQLEQLPEPSLDEPN